jgi:hypothetical protein
MWMCVCIRRATRAKTRTFPQRIPVYFTQKPTLNQAFFANYFNIKYYFLVTGRFFVQWGDGRGNVREKCISATDPGGADGLPLRSANKNQPPPIGQRLMNYPANYFFLTKARIRS